MSSLSRSAFSPALPTAMTMRPQLASSPAMAVLTSGELAIDSAMRLAALREAAPSTRDLDELARALAVAHHLLREVEQHLVERAPERGRGAGRRRRRSRARRACAAPVANSSSVSEVEVSLSTVMALNERVDRLRQQRLQRRRGDRRVGEDEGQHGRHVGRDHAGALGDAVDRHLRVAELRVRGGDLGKVSVVMIARAASISASGLALGDQRVERAGDRGRRPAARRSRRSRP